MKKNILTLVATGLVSLATAAHAEEFSYDSLSFGYTAVEADLGSGSNNVNGSQYAIGGSYAIKETAFYVIGGAAFGDYDLTLSNSQKVYSFGLGAHTSLSETVDAYVNASGTRVNARLEYISNWDTGYSASSGLRFAATDKIELSAGLTYTEVFDQSSTGVGLGASYKLTDLFSVGGHFTAAKSADLDSTSFGVFIRLEK